MKFLRNEQASSKIFHKKGNAVNWPGTKPDKCFVLCISWRTMLDPRYSTITSPWQTPRIRNPCFLNNALRSADNVPEPFEKKHQT